MKLPSLNTAIEELGGGEALWLRGHVAQHRLVPALFRFPGGVERERLFFAGSALVSGTSEQRAAGYFDALVTLHYSYVPTRLLAWTRSLQVALFCALVREHECPAVFVLNPVALNALSAIEGVVRVPGWQGPVGHARRERPIAIETTAAATSRCERQFTIHGTDALPLEEQCPSCVRRVILTKAEIAMAQRYVLSNWDASLLTF